MKNDVSILISSHSKAYDLWHITEYFFKKYWSECPFEIFLGANGENRFKFCPVGWKYLNYGKDISWSKSMIDYLSNINTKYVLLFLDDFILLNYVKEEAVKNLVDFAKKTDAMMIRTISNPKGDIEVDQNFDLVDIRSRVPYSTSLQVGLWNKDFLIDLLEYGFNPWEFKTKAGKTEKALKFYDKFFVSKKYIFKYTHFVEKGKFHPFIKELARKEKVYFDFSKRDFLNELDLKALKYSNLKSKVSRFIPNKYKNSIRKILFKNEL